MEDLLFKQCMQILRTMVRIKFELISNLCSGLSFMIAAVYCKVYSSCVMWSHVSGIRLVHTVLTDLYHSVTNEEVNFPFLYFFHLIMANSFHFKS